MRVTTSSVDTVVTNITGAQESPLPALATGYYSSALLMRMCIDPFSVVSFCFDAGVRYVDRVRGRGCIVFTS